MRYLVLAIFAQIRAIGVDDRGSVVVNALDVLLINRDDQSHAVFFCDLAHQLDGRPVRDFLDHAVPPRGLLGAEIRTGKDFLHAEDFRALAGSLVDQLQMLFNGVLPDFLERRLGGRRTGCLNQSATDSTRHLSSSSSFELTLSRGAATEPSHGRRPWLEISLE